MHLRRRSTQMLSDSHTRLKGTKHQDSGQRMRVCAFGHKTYIKCPNMCAWDRVSCVQTGLTLSMYLRMALNFCSPASISWMLRLQVSTTILLYALLGIKPRAFVKAFYQLRHMLKLLPSFKHHKVVSLSSPMSLIFLKQSSQSWRNLMRCVLIKPALIVQFIAV